MNSFEEFALFSRSEPEEHNIEPSEIFKDYKEHKTENIIPPVGIAAPELIESFQQNLQNENKILEDIRDLENYYRESPLETGIRQAQGAGLRFLEGVGGTIGMLLNALSGEAFFDEAGQPLPYPSQVPLLPSTEQLREFTKEKTRKKFEARTEKEKSQQEFAQTVGEIAPVPGLGLFAKLLIPAAGQATKQLIKESGGTESEADLGKLAFMQVASIANLGNAPAIARQAYNNAANMIPQGVRISAQPTQQAFARIRNQPWFRTGRTPAKNPAMREMTRIDNAIQNGTIDAHDAMQIRRDINEARKQLKGFAIRMPGEPVDTAQALRHLDTVDNALMESMTNYGRNVRPDWLREYVLANQAYGITQRSRDISDFITKFARPLQSQTAKTLFHLGGGAAIIKVPAIAGAAIPMLAAGKSIQIMNRLIRSPILRNHYTRVLAQASAGNIQGMQRELEKFDKISSKLEQSESKRTSKNLRKHQ